MTADRDQENWPSTTQQRALAYAPKPFAALSLLSAFFVMYYLLIRHPEKRKRMYHRLILAIFICTVPLFFALFWGTWAMPEDTPWTVGASGNTVTCSIQGFIYLASYLAFPFYYASLSVFAYVALKNNYEEEKYQWIEKWIHIGAYLFPLILGVVALAKDWIGPGIALCTLDVHRTCSDYLDPDCHYHQHASLIYAPVVSIVFIELLVGTFTIISLLCHFDKIQKDADIAIGMRRIVEEARRQRLKEVTLQTVLYLVSFWFGYIPTLTEHFVRLASGKLNFNLIVISHCCFGCQGFIILVIYFTLQSRSRRVTASEIVPGRRATMSEHSKHETVSKIRANAAEPRSPRSSLRGSRLSTFSFRIFDGVPAEDSPWAEFLDDGSDDDPGLRETVFEDEDESGHLTQPTSSNTIPLLEEPSEDDMA